MILEWQQKRPTCMQHIELSQLTCEEEQKEETGKHPDWESSAKYMSIPVLSVFSGKVSVEIISLQKEGRAID